MLRKNWLHYRILLGEKLGLKVPNTYNMKVEWIKLFDRNPIFVEWADKIRAKELAAKIIGDEYIIKTLGVYKNADEIDFDALPDKFVLKTNNFTSTNIICKDKSKLDIPKTRSTLNKWLKLKNIGKKSREWHYSLIEPKILCEEFVNDSSGNLYDHKFFCFNGKPCFAWTDFDRYGKNPSRAIFDIKWNRQDMTLYKPDYEGEPAKPENFEQMLEIAEKLSKGIKQVRVDLYNVDGKIYFGELTFFSGDMYFRPRKYNRIWGDMIDLKKD